MTQSIPDSSISASISFTSLPSVVLHEILDCLSVRERCRLTSLSRTLRTFRREYEANQRTLDLRDKNEDFLFQKSRLKITRSWALLSKLNNFISLQELNLGPHTDNEYFFFANQPPTNLLLPSLTRLSMARSQVDNRGLLGLSVSSIMDTLEEIDITYCHKTTYKGTFCLREKCKNLKLLRRQPSWMDGKFETPFSTDQLEVHTYWPDGSFEFSRSQQSSGFICELRELESDTIDIENVADIANDGRYVCDKLQYNDFVPPEGWPDWTRTSYRPGVSLLRLDDETNEKGEFIRSVLVAQKIRGLRPPTTIRALMEREKCNIPLGESRHYKSNGTQVPAERVEVERRLDNLILISRMRLIPFDRMVESLLPPEDLVAKNIEVCTRIADTAANYFEDILHLQLGGDPQVQRQQQRRPYVPRH